MKTSVIIFTIFVATFLGAGCLSSDTNDSVDARRLKWNKHDAAQPITYEMDYTNACILGLTNNNVWHTNSDGHTVVTLPVWTCGHAIESEAKSPDGNWIATVYAENCGAMFSFSSQINLRPSKAVFDEEDPKPFFIIDGLQRLSVSWISDTSILVKYPKPKNTNDVAFIKQNELNGIKITCETFPKP